MQESILARYFPDGDAFVQWIMQSTALAECIESWLMILCQVQDAQAVLEAPDIPADSKLGMFIAGRHAAQSLQAIAVDGGFTATAETFYAYYVQCCRALCFFGPSAEGVA